jgi:hypothetical protein
VADYPESTNLSADATVTCGQSPYSDVSFTLIEFGCIPSIVAFVFGTEYNKKIIDVSGAGASWRRRGPDV